MKKIIIITSCLLFTGWLGFRAGAQMATGNSLPHPSAGLDVTSSNKGILIPRMELQSTTDPNAVPGAAEGILIYNTRSNTINGQNVGFYYNTSAVSLKQYVRWATGAPLSAIWNRNGNRLLNGSSDFLGTTDDKPLHFRVNNAYVASLMHGSSNYFIAGTNKSAILGTHNVAIGQQALSGVGIGSRNTSVGAESLSAITSGDGNVAVGHLAAASGTLPSEITAVGYAALQNGISDHNIAMGAETMQETNRERNLAFGFRASRALRYSGTNPTLTTINNIAIGNEAMLNVTNCLNSVAVGHKAIGTANSSKDNLAIGREALLNATSAGERNIAIGAGAMLTNVNGTYNIAIGNGSLKALNSSGSNYNIGIGFEALGNLTQSANNTAVGAAAAGNISISGNGGQAGNTAIGTVSMAQLTSGVFSTAVGFGAFIIGNFNNSTAIGASALPSTANQVRLGNGSVTSIGGQVAWTSLSDGRAKTSINNVASATQLIKEMQPVRYRFSQEGLQQLQSLHGSQVPQRFFDTHSDNTIHIGFVAQQVKSVLQSHPDFAQIVDDSDVLGLRYELLVVPLVKTIQEQQALISQVKKQIEMLETQLITLKSME